MTINFIYSSIRLSFRGNAWFSAATRGVLSSISNPCGRCDRHNGVVAVMLAKLEKKGN
jgi:hypothetical protein